jgi:hypothetical protein
MFHAIPVYLKIILNSDQTEKPFRESQVYFILKLYFQLICNEH